MTPPLHLTSALLGGVACILFAAADLWYFGKVGTNTDLVIFFTGLGAFGVTGAYSAGLHSDPVPSVAPVPPPLPRPPPIQPIP